MEKGGQDAALFCCFRVVSCDFADRPFVPVEYEPQNRGNNTKVTASDPLSLLFSRLVIEADTRSLEE